MMPTPPPSANTGFWRCGHCGTPNPRASYLTACLGCGAPPSPPGFESRQAPTTAPQAGKPRPPALGLLATVAAYGLFLTALCVMARVIGDAWWPALVLLLSPRWIWMIPLGPLAVWAWRVRRAWIGGMLIVEAILVAGPLMGFNVPWGRLVAESGGPTLRILTFNRGGGRIDVARFARYLERNNVAVICFQEFGDDPALDAYLVETGWHRDSSRSIASRYPIIAEIARPPERNFDQGRYTMTLFRARIKAPDGGEFVVGSVHLPTLRPGIDRLLKGDLAGFRTQVAWWNSEFSRLVDALAETRGTPLLVGGDFNIPAESQALSGLRHHAIFQSAFEEAGIGWGYTRPAALPWVRIDHVLASPDWSIRRCWVGPDFGSDHRSLLAEVAPRSARP